MKKKQKFLCIIIFLRATEKRCKEVWNFIISVERSMRDEGWHLCRAVLYTSTTLKTLVGGTMTKCLPVFLPFLFSFCKYMNTG
jgi:hypothetical protein